MAHLNTLISFAILTFVLFSIACHPLPQYDDPDADSDSSTDTYTDSDENEDTDPDADTDSTIEQDSDFDTHEDTDIPIYIDECNNGEDLAELERLSESDNPMPAINYECTSICSSNPNPIDCFIICLNGATDLSEGCIHCFAVQNLCFVENCLECMKNPPPDHCDTCEIENCANDYEMCTGLGWYGPGSCANVDDVATLEELDTPFIFTTCLQICETDPHSPECMFTCYQEGNKGSGIPATGISENCIQCYSSLGECVINQCSGSCFGSPEAPSSKECFNCFNKHCAYDFVECSGRNTI